MKETIAKINKTKSLFFEKISKNGKPLNSLIKKKKDKNQIFKMTWKNAQHHSVSEKCKSKPQWDTTSHQSEWPPPKSLQTINAREGVWKREHSCISGGNVNWYSHYGRQYGDSLKS